MNNITYAALLPLIETSALDYEKFAPIREQIAAQEDRRQGWDTVAPRLFWHVPDGPRNEWEALRLREEHYRSAQEAEYDLYSAVKCCAYQLRAAGKIFF